MAMVFRAIGFIANRSGSNYDHRHIVGILFWLCLNAHDGTQEQGNAPISTDVKTDWFYLQFRLQLLFLFGKTA
ncbi:hypothetical protein [Frederiksenia canicola]